MIFRKDKPTMNAEELIKAIVDHKSYLKYASQARYALATEDRPVIYSRHSFDEFHDLLDDLNNRCERYGKVNPINFC